MLSLALVQAAVLVALDPQLVLREAHVEAPPAARMDARFSPSVSGTRGGRIEAHATVRGIPLTQPLAKVWVGDDGAPLLTTARRVMGPVRLGTTASLSAAAALSALETSGLHGAHGATEATLMVDPKPGNSELVWRIDPPVDPSTFSNPLFYVNAHDGRVELVFDRTRAAQVEAYAVNPVETPRAEVFDLYNVDETAEFLEGQYFRVRNCTLTDPDAGCVFAPSLLPDASGDFFYPVPDPSSPADNLARDDAYAEVSAYYNADRFQAYLAEFGDPGLDCSQGDDRVNITVNQHDFVDGELVGFDNAFYTGSCTSTIVMGQGTSVDFAWDGEVVLHELAHGITDRQTGPNGSLGGARRDQYSAGNDAGAINEGTSDFFGTVLSGERIYGNYTGPAFQRDLGRDITCPAGLPGEIHGDGILWATALLDVTDQLGDAFPPVVIDTLGMLPLDVSFDEASSTLEALTRDALGEDAGDVVQEVFTDRGLFDCERIAAIEDATSGMWLLPASWDVNYNPVRPPPFQLRFEVPPNAVNVTVTFEPRDFLPKDFVQSWTADIVLKPDEPIIFTYEEAQGGLVYVEADSVEQSAFVDNTWMRPVQGGEVFYAAMFNRGDTIVQMQNITVEYELTPEAGTSSSSGDPGEGTAADESGEPPIEPESTSTGVGMSEGDTGSSGQTSANQDDAGCGCRSHDSAPAGWLMLFGLGAVMGRRREG